MSAVKGTKRPHKWISGPDENRHSKFDPWHKMRAQANYRGEAYHLTFDDFCELWTDDLWERRGRKSDDLTLTRINPSGAWEVSNVKIVTRKTQLDEARQRRNPENQNSWGWKTKRQNLGEK